MIQKPMLVPLTLAQQWWGLDPASLEAWAAEDGLSLMPSPWGLALQRRDLRAALTRRRRPLPADLIEWPKLLVAGCRAGALEALNHVIESRFPDAIVSLAEPELALAALEMSKPNAVILDLESPRFDGIGLVRRAASLLPTAKAVILGGTPAQLDELEDLRADEALYLPRTPTPRDLDSALESLLRPRRSRPQKPKPLLARLFAWR